MNTNKDLTIGKLFMQNYGINPQLDKLVDSENVGDRLKMAEQGYGIDKLINDEDILVQQMCLTSDNWSEFCIKNWETLINHKLSTVRVSIAKYGYGLNILINDTSWRVRNAVATYGYGLNILINDINRNVSHTAYNYLKQHNYKSINDWSIENPNMVHNDINTQINDTLKNFIDKINESHTLEVQSSYDNFNEFFFNNEHDILIICTADTKTPIIKIEKTFNETSTFKFIAEITNQDSEDFILRTTIKSNEQFIKNVEQTIDALKLYSEFCKYINDLENCL